MAESAAPALGSRNATYEPHAARRTAERTPIARSCRTTGRAIAGTDTAGIAHVMATTRGTAAPPRTSQVVQSPRAAPQDPASARRAKRNARHAPIVGA